jgi:hypothetical protein
MPKLSATTPADQPGEVTRVDITPEMIKSFSDEKLNQLLRELRGNREVGAGPKRTPSSGGSATPKPAKPPTDVEDLF